MERVRPLIGCVFAVCVVAHAAFSQPARLLNGNKECFISGTNLAWIDFAADVGPGTIDLQAFSVILRRVHDHGGNAVRWWLHTNGTVTPEFSPDGLVTGPGAGTIQDIRCVLDSAREMRIGVTLCLWSHDMLTSSTSPPVLNRNVKLLTDPSATQAYIDKCLIPMIDSLKGHPAILAWEIFNEPEGMSDEYGWSTVRHVPFEVIQRFINRSAGAIHRRDPKALVTCGAWAFHTLTDVPAAGRPAYNYYRDDRLIAAGGDSAGLLDFYSVHYFEGIGSGRAISPFHHAKEYWRLDKPLVVAEFAVRNTFGVPKESLYDVLFRLGYAGALAWSWTDDHVSSHDDVLALMGEMWKAHRPVVELNNFGGEWAIGRQSRPAPVRFVLEQNFPNPFNATTTIQYDLPEPGAVIITVYDVLGREAATLVNGEHAAGSYTVHFDGSTAASGVYIYRIIATGGQSRFVDAKRCVLVK